MHIDKIHGIYTRINPVPKDFDLEIVTFLACTRRNTRKNISFKLPIMLLQLLCHIQSIKSINCITSKREVRTQLITGKCASSSWNKVMRYLKNFMIFFSWIIHFFRRQRFATGIYFYVIILSRTSSVFNSDHNSKLYSFRIKTNANKILAFSIKKRKLVLD